MVEVSCYYFGQNFEREISVTTLRINSFTLKQNAHYLSVSLLHQTFLYIAELALSRCLTNKTLVNKLHTNKPTQRTSMETNLNTCANSIFNWARLSGCLGYCISSLFSCKMKYTCTRFIIYFLFYLNTT